MTGCSGVFNLRKKTTGITISTEAVSKYRETISRPAKLTFFKIFRISHSKVVYFWQANRRTSMKHKINPYILALVLLLPICVNAGLVMSTHGYITLESYIHGISETRGEYPAYRSETMAYVDVYRWNRLYLNALLGNTTMISHSDSLAWRLNRIRYTLSPGFRIEFDKWLIKGTLFHECIHLIDQREEIIPGFQRGSTWWNSLQIGIGTKGAYYLYLRDQYRRINNKFLNSWDAQINFGRIIPAQNTITTGQNHNYRYELFSLLRYHIGSYWNWASFVSLRQNLWVNADHSVEHKIGVTVNFFRRGTVNFAGIFYTYYLYDTFLHDNEDSLGALGVRVVF